MDGDTQGVMAVLAAMLPAWADRPLSEVLWRLGVFSHDYAIVRLASGWFQVFVAPELALLVRVAAGGVLRRAAQRRVYGDLGGIAPKQL